MAKILFLAHRMPFPPDKGDKIRAFHFLKHLAARHEVWLAAGADDPADLAHLPEARALCVDACVAPLGRLRRAWNMAGGLATGAPLSVARFRHPALDRWIGRVLREVRPDVVFVFSSALAQYVAGRLPPGARLVVDFVDADAEKWRAYAEASRPPLRWIYAREASRLARFDKAVLRCAAAGLVISETERRLLAGLVGEEAGKLQVTANGVDTGFFQPAPASAAAGRIVLCGRMDYLPNIDGAQWFAREVLPRVRERRPDAVFRIVGAEPTAAVQALADLPGVEVTGAVPDVRPHLAEAAAVVAPLRIARGIQNKVLEGMAAGRPVIATPEALDGIGAEAGREVLVAADAPAFAEAVCEVLLGDGGPALGARGRAFVLRHHQWAAKLGTLDRIIADLAGGASRQAPA